MFSNSSWRSSSKGRGNGTKSVPALSITTSEDSGCELIARPGSNGSDSTRSKTSKTSASSRSSGFRKMFRRSTSSSGAPKRKKKYPSRKATVSKVPPTRTAAVAEKERTTTTASARTMTGVEKDPTVTTIAASTSERISPPVELRLRLLPRIAEYRECRWITAKEEKAFMDLLADHPVDFGSHIDHAAVQVENALNLMRDHKQKKPMVDSEDGSSHSHERRPDAVATQSSGDSSNTRGSIQQGDASIRAPSELWDGKLIDDKAKLEELFVEMCFFARLGFIQPPSCLRCVHRESMNDKTPNLSCKRWVAWRKIAMTQLHPHTLEGNVLMVQCHAARSLVKGDRVQGWEWDATKKVLAAHEE